MLEYDFISCTQMVSSTLISKSDRVNAFLKSASRLSEATVNDERASIPLSVSDHVNEDFNKVEQSSMRPS
jgi:hypothetical protein